jgi:hypothetical protein
MKGSIKETRGQSECSKHTKIVSDEYLRLKSLSDEKLYLYFVSVENFKKCCNIT